jgi:hypothetical protein
MRLRSLRVFGFTFSCLSGALKVQGLKLDIIESRCFSIDNRTPLLPSSNKPDQRMSRQTGPNID